MLIYKSDDGRIIANIPDGQPFSYLSEKNLVGLEVGNIPEDWYNYKVIDNKLARMSELEIGEIRDYGRFLTNEERLLESMKPSHEEINKAEETIQLLSLLQEVLE